MLQGIFIWPSTAQHKHTHSLTIGPGGPLGPDDPSFPGGPYAETTYNRTWVTTHWGPPSCNTSVSWLYIGFSLESVFLNYIYEWWLTSPG